MGKDIKNSILCGHSNRYRDFNLHDLYKKFSNLLVLFIAIVFTVWMKIQSKQMVEIYNKNPDAEVIDLFYLKYKEKEHIKSQKKIKRTDFAV